MKDKLNELRQKANLNLTEIAERSKVPYSTVQKIFNGTTSNPNSEALYQILKVMGATTEDLYGQEKGEEMSALEIIRETYEHRIADIKEADAQHIATLTKHNRYLIIALSVIGAFLIGVLIFDIMNGGVGYVRY